MRLRPRLGPGPRWGSLQHSRDPLAGFGGGNREGEWKGLERKRTERNGTKREKRGGCGMEIRGFASLGLGG